MSWRPFEPSRDETKRINDERERNSCNLHNDCAAADAKLKTEGGRLARIDGWADGRFVRAGERIYTAFHCSSEDCEDCLGC